MSDYIKNYLQKIQTCNRCKDGEECYGIFRNKKRIVAIGDIHGDFDMFITALIKAKVISTQKISEDKQKILYKPVWIGGNTIVVQMGDLLDSGGRQNSIESTINDELLILKALEDIDKLARKDGGRCISLIGNHELMNLRGDFRYATDNTIKMFDVFVNGQQHNRKSLFQPGGILATKLAELCYGIVKINDWVFVHAGFLPKHLKHTMSLEENFKEINQLVKNIFMKPNAIQSLTSEQLNLIFGREGIFWTRKLSEDGFSCKEIEDKLLSFTPINLNKGGIVVGHTAQIDGIGHKCNKRIWFVDHAISKAFGNQSTKRVEVFEISYLENGQEKLRVIKK